MGRNRIERIIIDVHTDAAFYDTTNSYGVGYAIVMGHKPFEVVSIHSTSGDITSAHSAECRAIALALNNICVTYHAIIKNIHKAEIAEVRVFTDALHVLTRITDMAGKSSDKIPKDLIDIVHSYKKLTELGIEVNMYYCPAHVKASKEKIDASHKMFLKHNHLIENDINFKAFIYSISFNHLVDRHIEYTRHEEKDKYHVIPKQRLMGRLDSAVNKYMSIVFGD